MISNLNTVDKIKITGNNVDISLSYDYGDM